jgi:hypothetical protein
VEALLPAIAEPAEVPVTFPVAVVMAAVASGIMGDGSDSDEYVLAPYHTPHFKWDCLIGGPNVSSEELVTVLIDNGSHSVLIRPCIDNIKRCNGFPHCMIDEYA